LAVGLATAVVGLIGAFGALGSAKLDQSIVGVFQRVEAASASLANERQLTDEPDAIDATDRAFAALASQLASISITDWTCDAQEGQVNTAEVRQYPEDALTAARASGPAEVDQLIGQLDAIPQLCVGSINDTGLRTTIDSYAAAVASTPAIGAQDLSQRDATLTTASKAADSLVSTADGRVVATAIAVGLLALGLAFGLWRLIRGGKAPAESQLRRRLADGWHRFTGSKDDYDQIPEVEIIGPPGRGAASLPAMAAPRPADDPDQTEVAEPEFEPVALDEPEGLPASPVAGVEMAESFADPATAAELTPNPAPPAPTVAPPPRPVPPLAPRPTPRPRLKPLYLDPMPMSPSAISDTMLEPVAGLDSPASREVEAPVRGAVLAKFAPRVSPTPAQGPAQRTLKPSRARIVEPGGAATHPATAGLRPDQISQLLAAEQPIALTQAMTEALAQVSRPHQVRWSLRTESELPAALAPRLAHVVAELIDAATAKNPALVVLVTANQAGPNLYVTVSDRAAGGSNGRFGLGSRSRAIQAVADRMGASLTSRAGPGGRGSDVTVSLPLQPEAESAAVASPAPAAPRQPSPAIAAAPPPVEETTAAAPTRSWISTSPTYEPARQRLTRQAPYEPAASVSSAKAARVTTTDAGSSIWDDSAHQRRVAPPQWGQPQSPLTDPTAYGQAAPAPKSPEASPWDSHGETDSHHQTPATSPALTNWPPVRAVEVPASAPQAAPPAPVAPPDDPWDRLAPPGRRNGAA